MVKNYKAFTHPSNNLLGRQMDRKLEYLKSVNQSHNKSTLVGGFTLMEIVVVIAITGLIVTGLGVLVYWSFNLWQNSQAQVRAQENVRIALEGTAGIIREAQINDRGSYPIESVGALSFIFYANIDDQSDRERVRFFLDGDILKRGVIKSSGDPPEYLEANEKISTVASYIRNNDYIFRYYDSSYSLLSEPIDLNEIRLMEIRLLIDEDLNKLPSAVEVKTDISFRNLKDI